MFVFILPLQDSLKGPMTRHGESPWQSENPYVPGRVSSCCIITAGTFTLLLVKLFPNCDGPRKRLIINLLTAQHFPASLQFSRERKEILARSLLSANPVSLLYYALPVGASLQCGLQQRSNLRLLFLTGLGSNPPHVTYQRVIMRVVLNLIELWASHL